MLAFTAGTVSDRLIVGIPVHAQTRNAPPVKPGGASLELGSATIVVGMTREEAARIISRAGYFLGASNEGRPTLVMTRAVTRNGITHANIFGSITFENGIVTNISRNWGNPESGPEVENVRKSLWGVVANSIPIDQPFMPVYVRTYRNTSPQMRRESIDILIDKSHTITVERSEIISSDLLEPGTPLEPFISVEETVF